MIWPRRQFLHASWSVPLAAALPQQEAAATSTPDRQTKDATLPLAALRARYRRYLFDDFLPFVDRHVIDRDRGGFMCAVGPDGTRAHVRKAVWFEGRGTWVYAFLYAHFGRDPRHLAIARRSFDFVLRVRPASGGKWPKELTRDGQPYGPPEAAVYGGLFVAEGAAALALATGDRHYWDLGRELVLEAVREYDRDDYDPNIGQTYLGPNARTFPGARVQGVWMVLIRAVTQLLEQRGDAALEDVAGRCVEAIAQRHFNPAFRLNNELLNHDLSRPSNEYEQLVYTGHAIESLWMFVRESQRRKDAALIALFIERFRRHVEVAWDDVYGGVFRNLMAVDANTWTVDKVLWAQEEVLIGSLLIYEHTGAGWARDLFTRALDYVESTFPLTAHGSPLWMYAGDRRVSYESFQALPKRLENYHHPRHLMLNLLTLDRLIARAGGHK